MKTNAKTAIGWATLVKTANFLTIAPRKKVVIAAVELDKTEKTTHLNHGHNEQKLQPT